MHFACSVILAADVAAALSIVGIVCCLSPLRVYPSFTRADDRNPWVQGVQMPWQLHLRFTDRLTPYYRSNRCEFYGLHHITGCRQIIRYG